MRCWNAAGLMFEARREFKMSEGFQAMPARLFSPFVLIRFNNRMHWNTTVFASELSGRGESWRDAET